MSTQCFAVVLDLYGRRLGRAQGIDAQQVGQRTMVHGDRLRDLQETDQLKTIKSLRAGLVVMDLREPCVDGRVGRDESVDVSEPEEPPHCVHRCVHRGVHQAAIAQVSDVQLDVYSLDPFERVQPVGLAPRKPPPQLGGVEDVGLPGVPGKI